jgi:hypothetical protein
MVVCKFRFCNNFTIIRFLFLIIRYVECPEHPRHKQHHTNSLLDGFDSIPNGYIKKK